MRYLSGTEIARLMGFPVGELAASTCDDSDPTKEGSAVIGAGEAGPYRKFSFPPVCTLRQQWKLLGNSLNVNVAAGVAEIGIRSLLNDLKD